MESKLFIQRFKDAFGNVELPIAFWYSDNPHQVHEKINGCFFKVMNEVRNGNIVTLGLESIGCMGGKLYTGFGEFNEHIANYVSLKEKYKKTPEMVVDFVEGIRIADISEKYLTFARIDQIVSLDQIEGLIFFATPDVLTGLAAWAFYDTNAEDAILCAFNSGCSATVSRVVTENKSNGKRCFLGFLDPSVRPYIESNILTFSIPNSRFKEMYDTILECCLKDTHAWKKVRARINENV